MSLEEIVQRFRAQGLKCVRCGQGYRCQCPGHGGQDTNLALAPGSNGGILVKCHSHGCDLREVAAGGGLEVSDFMPPQARANGGGRAREPEPKARYRYTDAGGELLFEVWRFEPGFDGRKKDFRPHHLGPDGHWVPGDPAGVTKPLYRLPELLAADPKEPVFICAGEKDCDNLRRLGLVATTNPGGEAVQWGRRPEWLEPLKGRRCIILEDFDPPDQKRKVRPGEEHSKEVFAALTRAGIEAKRLLLPGLQEGEDVSDWIPRGGTGEDLRQLAQRDPHPLTLTVVGGNQLAGLVLPQPEALVPNLVYRGFSTLLAGDSKLGKSSLMLRMMLAMASGGWWLDREKRSENRLARSRVLFVNFEDPLALTQERALRMMAPEGIPEGFFSMPPPYGFRLAEIIVWLKEAQERFALDAVVLDPIAIAAEWKDETDNAEVAMTFKPLQRLASETNLAVLSAHHVTKKPGTRGLNIRGGSAIKANVMGYLVLEPEAEGIRLSGINKWTGEWDVLLGREERDLSWWIEKSYSGHTRTPQQAIKEEAKSDLLAMVREEAGITTERLAVLLDLHARTCYRYLEELAAAGLVFERALPRAPDQRGRAPSGWFSFPLAEEEP